MRYLKTNTAILLCVGPFLDKTDGVTSEVGSMAASVTTLIAETDAGSAPTIVLDNVLGNDATNPVTHITNDDAGYYYLTLTAANLNRLGRAMVTISGPATHCPVFHELMILPANIYDSMILGTDLFDVSCTQILGTAVSTPATAGILDVNLKNIANATVSASTAQLGVNVVNFGGSAGTFAGGRAETNVSHWLGTAAATPTVAGVPEMDVTHWNGTAVSAPGTAGIPEVNLKNIANAAVSASTAQLGVNVVNFGGSAGTFASGIPSSSLTTAAINSVADQVWDEALSGHVAAGSAGSGSYIIRSNTAQAGDATHITLDASASAVDDFYNSQQLSIVSGTGVGQGRIISDYVGSTKIAAVATWGTNPDATSVFVIEPFGSIPGASAPTAAEVADAVLDEALVDHVTSGSLGQMIGGLGARTGTAQAGAASSITLDASASATNDLYNYSYISLFSGTGAGQTRQITDYVGATKVATTNLAWTVNPDATSVFFIFPCGLDATTVATIVTGVWAATRAGNAAAGSMGEYVNADVLRVSGNATAADNAQSFFDGTGYAGTGNVIPSVTTVTGNVNGNVGGNVTGSVGSVTGAVGSVTAFAANSVTAAAIAADAVTEIQSGLATAAALTTVDTVVDAIKVKTDSLTFTVAGQAERAVHQRLRAHG
jgi:hypothetical protein